MLMGRLIKQANNTINQRMNAFAQQYRLTGTQMSVINFLDHFPGNTCAQREIEREFDIKRSTTTVLLQRMEKKGLVTRQTSPTNQQSKLVSLTSSGEKLIPIVNDYIEQSEIRLIDGLDGDSIKKIKQFLREVSERLNG
ncbi:MarR family winged helix-turn-helix transcriptional regulator [Limosilactobacillus caviae]|uniref:Transcriptional regulator n=2 Tax=Limosilactobacillus caviae TaxID=1769424 RepID=A0ABQ2C8Q7_9LACO|nr:MarR family transcriptional regulator [Limosilactobacillus reuteri]GGI63144.1 transcriptional regulator [Limosilactobacillus caviae]